MGADQEGRDGKAVVRDDSVLSERQRADASDRTERAAASVNGTGDRSAIGDKSHDAVRDVHHPSVGDQVGEAAGGISGVLAGAAIGSFGGPIGTVIGGIAGAIGGWWTGRAISEAASNFTHADDAHFRDAYERSEARLADRSYDDVRPAFQLGHLASRNPEYQGRDFDEVERDLERGWSSDVSRTSGEWHQVRDFARDAYARGRERGNAGDRASEVGSEAPSRVGSAERSWHSDHVEQQRAPRDKGSAGTAP